MPIVIKKKTIKVVALLIVLLVIAFIGYNYSKGDQQMKNPHAIFDTTKGSFEVELYQDKAPKTVENFLNLTKKGFYDGVLFHRVIPNFMVQTGDPNGDGTGGPGYEIQDEFHPSLKHDKKGVLSMANRGPNTGGSQLFVTVAPTPWLDGKHAIFGQVVKGQDVVDAISTVPRGPGDRPNDPIKINSIKIV